MRKKNFEHIISADSVYILYFLDIPRKVQVLDANNYEIEGKKNFIKADGTLTKEKMPYRMTGWIGIHTSIKKVEAQWTFLGISVISSIVLPIFTYLDNLDSKSTSVLL